MRPAALLATLLVGALPARLTAVLFTSSNGGLVDDLLAAPLTTRFTSHGARVRPTRRIFGKAGPVGYLNGPLPIAFAHRGGVGHAHENSMAAFQYCIDLGYRYLETDVQLSADGVVVAFHDATLERLTGRAGRIADTTWDQLATINNGAAPAISRLDEILETWPTVNLNIDAKTADVVEPLAALVVRRSAESRVCLTSFIDGRIARLRALVGPTAITGVGRAGVGLLRAASYAGRRGTMLQIPGHCVQVPVAVRGKPLVDARFVSLVHELGKQVHVWTIDDPAEMSRLIAMNVDGIMTDRPEVLKEVLQTRGLWTTDTAG